MNRCDILVFGVALKPQKYKFININLNLKYLQTDLPDYDVSL